MPTTVFPLSPTPAYVAVINPAANHGVYYVGGTAAPAITLSASGATGYTVRDYWGNIVSSGSCSGTTVTPIAPAGGWPLGWYRIYLTGASTDSLFGTSYGTSNFCVIRNDARFPAMPAPAVSGGEVRDIAGKGAMGMGTSRLPIGDVTAPTTGSDTLAIAQADVVTSKSYWCVPSGNAYYDSVRPARLLWTNFPALNTTDMVTVNGNLRIYCKDETVNGSTVTVTVVTGTTSGFKITVNAETYDNLATADAAAVALNASALVRGFGTGALATMTATTVGRASWNGVVSIVSTLYPDVTRFEGPLNEPSMNAETVLRMRIFQAAVHAGNASAKAIGPCPVQIDGIEPFLALGGGAYCDEIAVHAYNAQTNGDINQGRTQLAAFTAILAQYGQGSKAIWQTESTHVWSTVYSVYHPRRSRVPLLMTLLMEQYGIPRERNNYWYDVSHFWGYPSFWQCGDRTFNPMAPLYRVLAEETFGQVHSSAMSFGTLGDKIFLGSIYAGASTSTAVMVAQSYMPNCTVTLNVTGTTSPLTLSDGFGKLSTLTVTNGQVVVPLSDIPSYLRLPAGVTVTVSHCMDWPTKQSGWISQAVGNPGPAVTSGTLTPTTYVNDNGWQFRYSGAGPIDGSAVGTGVPDTVTITWPTATRLDRVLLWCGNVWQARSTLIDFDIQTSVDGTTWVTQSTVTKTTPSSFLFGSDPRSTGTQRETFWDEQWIFDVKLPAIVAAKAVRLNVRAASYGGEPDLAASNSNGAGTTYQFVTLQEMAVLCDDNVNNPHFGGR